MDKVPPTGKTDLEKIQEQLDEEADRWNQLGMRADMIKHTGESIWILKLQLQAMMNAALKAGILTEDDVNIEFKTLMLNDMKVYREQAEEQHRESLVPEIKLVGPDGKPLKF